MNDLIAYLLTPAAQIALIIGLAELVKKLGLENRWVPLFDLFMGLISGLCVYGLAMGHGVVNGLILGIFMGLSACGLFSGVKNLTQKPDVTADLQTTMNTDTLTEMLEEREIYNVSDADDQTGQ